MDSPPLLGVLSRFLTIEIHINQVRLSSSAYVHGLFAGADPTKGVWMKFA